MRHLHQMVIDDVGKVVRRQLVGTLEQHLVVQYATINGHKSANQVVHHHFASRFNLEANDVLMTFVNQALHLVGRQSQRITHLTACLCVVLEVLYFLALRIQFLGGVKSDVCLSCVKQLLDVFLVNVATFALAVRSVLTTIGNAFVKLNTQPTKCLDDVLLRSWYEAGRVGVLNTENQVASVLFGE